MLKTLDEDGNEILGDEGSPASVKKGVMKKSSKKMNRGDGEVVLYGETKAGETSQVTESQSLDNVGIAKANKGVTNDDFDFVGHLPFLVPSSSTVSKSDELKATEMTTNVVKELKKTSLTML